MSLNETTMTSARLQKLAAAHLRLRWDVKSALSVMRTGQIDDARKALESAIARAEERHSASALELLRGRYSEDGVSDPDQG